MSLNAQQILEKLQWRYATKVFDKNKKISNENWELLEKSLQLSPSSFGLQPYKFIVVENPELREKLKAVSWNQGQVTDASHYVVITALKTVKAEYIKDFIDLNASTREVPRATLEGYENMMLNHIVKGFDADLMKTWSQRQAYISMGFLLETAALLDIDAVPLEGIDPKAYDKLLNLEDTDYGAVAAVGLGYRDESDKYQLAKKVRFPLERLIQHV